LDYTKEQLAAMLRVDEFPRSAKYDLEWVLQNEMGPHVLWLTEALSQQMDLTPDMRVLDMGCGTAMSSIFLAKEFGVQVWANDLWMKWEEVRKNDFAVLRADGGRYVGFVRMVARRGEAQ